MSDQSITSIIIAVSGAVTSIFLGWIGYMQFKIKLQAEAATTKAKEVAEKVADVATELRAVERAHNVKLDHIVNTGDKTLTHVNDQFLIQLKLNAESMRVVAAFRKWPGDEELAQAAERLYISHYTKQQEAVAATAATNAVQAVANAAIENSKVTAISLEKH